MPTVTIIGGGLAGCLLSLLLSKRGYQISIYESRKDLRIDDQDFGRSINMALSCRGMTALESLDLLDKVKPIMVPMRARAIYESDGGIKFQPFGRHHDEYINSIKRTDLNRILLDCIDETPNISLYFDHRLSEIDFENKQCEMVHNNQVITISYEHLIGADGANSAVRDSLVQANIVKATRDFLPHGYKELTIAGPDNDTFEREHLHMWPRDSYLLLGNPNPDHSITGSLFLSFEGETSFSSLVDERAVRDFFHTQFSEAAVHMSKLEEEFFSHPLGYLSTVKCEPWYYKDQCLLIGDAAHAIVPFFGQGMNAAFEDCRIFDSLLDKFDNNWSEVIPAFYHQRKLNTDAVAAMSMDNYREIRHDVLDEHFLFRKALEHELMRRYSHHYLSRHVMVMFTNLPYSAVYEQSQKQLRFIERLCQGKQSINEIDWDSVDKLIEKDLLNTYQLLAAHEQLVSNSFAMDEPIKKLS